MADLATIDDVQANYRDLRGNEPTLAATWLTTASAELRLRVDGLAARMLVDDDFAIKVRDLVAWAVAQTLRRGDRNDPASGDWVRFFTDADIDLLISSGASATSSGPVGYFPDLVEYPVY